MDIVRDIDSLTGFKRHTARAVARLKETGGPLVLTHNGKAEIVVQSAEAYQRMADVVERAEAIEGICRGFREASAGQGGQAREVLEELRLKHGLPRT